MRDRKEFTAVGADLEEHGATCSVLAKQHNYHVKFLRQEAKAFFQPNGTTN